MTNHPQDSKDSGNHMFSYSCGIIQAGRVSKENRLIMETLTGYLQIFGFMKKRD